MKHITGAQNSGKKQCYGGILIKRKGGWSGTVNSRNFINTSVGSCWRTPSELLGSTIVPRGARGLLAFAPSCESSMSLSEPLCFDCWDTVFLANTVFLEG